jgi:hypothetical protein
MKLIITTIIAGIFLLCPTQTLADEFSDLMRLRRVYNTKAMFLEFKVDINYNDKKHEEYQGKYYKNSNGFCYNVFHVETFCNSKYSVIVDKNQKLLLVGDAAQVSSTDKEISNFISQLQTDTLSIKIAYDLKYVGDSKNTIKTISLVPKDEDNEFSSIEISINSDFTLSKIKYNYRTSEAKTHIANYIVTYQKQELKDNIKLPGGLSKYVEIKKSGISPSKTYSGYKIIDNRYKSK